MICLSSGEKGRGRKDFNNSSKKESIVMLAFWVEIQEVVVFEGQ